MTSPKTKSTSKVEKILEFRNTHTLAETGKRFKLTAERIRQIEHLKDRKRCAKHKRFYYNTCSHCLGENYRGYLNKLNYEQILKEVKKERKNRKRDYLSVWRRAYLVEVLYMKYTKSYLEISELLQRDYSTISNLVRKLNNSYGR